MSGIATIRSIQVAPKLEKLPEDRTWKKCVVSVIPVLGPGLGCFFLDTLHLKSVNAKKVDQTSILKVAKLYHLLIGINTATYGIASIAISIQSGSWGMFVAGAGQIFMSFEQFDFMKNAQVLIEKSLQTP